jgi:hypothetical protein
VKQVRDDEAFRLQYREEARARINTRHSQQQQPSSSLPLPPFLNASAPVPLLLNTSSSGIPSFSSSSSSSKSHSDGNSETGDVTKTAEALQPRQPRRGVRRTQKLINNSQTAKEVAISKGNGKSKGHKPGKKTFAAAAEMSQLLDDYVPPPSSAVLLKD